MIRSDCNPPISPAALILIIALLSGCASNRAAEANDINDPFEPVNRQIYRFNEFADKWVARPIAKGYQFVTPAIVRTGVTNFFDNLSYPVDIINALLQGKFSQAGLDTSRLVINTTVGVLGIMDPATDAGLAKNNEDFGQTLGAWGVPEGPFIIVPFFGPRTFRSGTGDLVDLYINPQFRIFSSSVQTKVNIFWLVHERSKLIGIDEEVQRAFDRYAFVRDAYLQNRQFLLYDGNPPEELLDFEEFDEEFDEEFE